MVVVVLKAQAGLVVVLQGLSALVLVVAALVLVVAALVLLVAVLVVVVELGLEQVVLLWLSHHTSLGGMQSSLVKRHRGRRSSSGSEGGVGR